MCFSCTTIASFVVENWQNVTSPQNNSSNGMENNTGIDPRTVLCSVLLFVMSFITSNISIFSPENEIDGATLLGLLEQMCECIFPKIKDQVRFMSILTLKG